MAIKIRVVNMIPQSVSNESNEDCEPDLAVHSVNPWQVAGTTSLTSDPGGSPFAPIFVSRDRGRTWTLNPIIPGATTILGTTFGTFDVTLRYSRQELYVTPVRADTGNLVALRTADPFTATSLQTIDTVTGSPDQPFVRAITVAHGPDTGKDRVYIGFNNLNLFPGATASIDVSADGEASSPVFNRVVIEFRNPGAAQQDGPAVRPAVHHDGTVYAAFMGWRAPNGTITDVVVVRDDHWGIGGAAFQDLIDTDALPGLRVAAGVSNLALGTVLGAGQQRVGNDLTLAVDPRNSSRVFIAWCDLQAAVYTLHVRASEDRGKTWSAADLLTVTNVTNPALAINSRGKVGLLYQQLTTGPSLWETHVRFSRSGSHWDDYVLSTTPAAQPVANPNIGPYLGDYEQLLAQGTDFYGVFCANNTPDLANFPHGVHYQRNANFSTKTLLDVTGINPVAISIDPFFFHISWPEEEEEERDEEGEFGRDLLRLKGLKYESLEISELDMAFGEGASLRGRRLRGLLRRFAGAFHDDDRD